MGGNVELGGASDREALAYIGLGANLGDSAAVLAFAIEAIGSLPLTRITRRSSVWKSAPVDAEGPDYLNAVVAASTGLGAAELLAELQRIENRAGRKRPYRNAPRTLDLDLLLFGDATSNDPQLTLPHPRMTGRAFVLSPLAEIAPELVTPKQLAAVAGQRIERLVAP
ncbi:MAG: 2-amino-4-hydroxy-6-hydroxymethyldihydropteridine diphosphokinase [Burkholderiales bacterium]